MLLLLWQTGISGYAQECNINITGIVKDSSENHPLSSTVVEVVGKNHTTISNKDGAFKLSNLCADSIEIHVSHLNCEHIHLNFKITKDTFIVIYLKHQELVLPEFKLQVNKKGIISDHLNARQIERSKGLSISALMTELGGVSLLQSGAGIGKPIINGLHSSRVLIINNGIRQEGQNWGAEHAPEIDALLATDITLIKGAESLRYGSDGIGGVILVQSPSIFRERANTISGEFNSIGMSNARAGIVSIYAGNKISDKLPLYWRLQGTYKNAGSYSIPNFNLANTGIRESNYSLHLGYAKGRLKSEFFHSRFKTIIGLYPGAIAGNLSDLQIAMNSTEPMVKSTFNRQINRAYQEVSHQLSKLKNEWHIKNKQMLELTLSYQQNHRQEYDILRSASSSKAPAFDYYINTLMGDFIWQRYDFHKSNIKFGVFGMHQSNAYTGRFFIPGFYQNGIAQYGILTRQSKKQGIELALRNDFKTFDIYLWNGKNLNIQHLNYQGWSYLIQWYKQVDEHSRLTFNHSSTWRPPSTNELYANGLHQALASIEIGDSTLSKERSFNGSVIYQFKSRKIHAEAELYIKSVEGYINLIPGNTALLTIRGAFPVFRYEQSNALLYGSNMHVQWQINKLWSIKSKIQLLYGQDRTRSEFLNMMPPLNGKTGLSYEKKQFGFDLFADYVGKQTRYNPGSDFMAPPEAYYLIGGNFNYQLKVKNQTIRFSLSVNNALNRTYRSYLNRLRYFIDEQGRNITFRIIIPIN